MQTMAKLNSGDKLVLFNLSALVAGDEDAIDSYHMCCTNGGADLAPPAASGKMASRATDEPRIEKKTLHTVSPWDASIAERQICGRPRPSSSPTP